MDYVLNVCSLYIRVCTYACMRERDKNRERETLTAKFYRTVHLLCQALFIVTTFLSPQYTTLQISANAKMLSTGFVAGNATDK